MSFEIRSSSHFTVSNGVLLIFKLHCIIYTVMQQSASFPLDLYSCLKMLTSFWLALSKPWLLIRNTTGSLFETIFLCWYMSHLTPFIASSSMRSNSVVARTSTTAQWASPPFLPQERKNMGFSGVWIKRFCQFCMKLHNEGKLSPHPSQTRIKPQWRPIIGHLDWDRSQHPLQITAWTSKRPDISFFSVDFQREGHICYPPDEVRVCAKRRGVTVGGPQLNLYGSGRRSRHR